MREAEIFVAVPGNLKSSVNKASFYDPEINRSYGKTTAHYGVGVLPARPRKPKDKGKVEAGVKFAQMYILGRLRNQQFFSLAEANQAIVAAAAGINDYVMRRLGLSLRQLFETTERPALGALPDTDYEFAEWCLARVSLDYHVEVCGFYYSMPHNRIRAEVDNCATARMVEIFFQGNRIAVHQRRYGGARHGIDPEQMPSAHRRYAEWTPERFRQWGAKIGPQTEGLMVAILARRPHPERSFRTCVGVLLLFRGWHPVARRRWRSAPRPMAHSPIRTSPRSSAKNSIAPAKAADEAQAVLLHEYLRGAKYFH